MIKKFENYNSQEETKFRIGNYVRINYHRDSDPQGIRAVGNVYKIISIDDWELQKGENENKYYLDKAGWEYGKNLILVPDYEVDAIKYNL